MLRFAPNISWLFPQLPFAERPAAVAAAGFDALEFGFPSHVDLDALQAARDKLGLDLVLFNQDVPVWDRDNRGYLVDPGRRAEFRRELERALEICDLLAVPKVMLPAGVQLPAMERSAQRDCMIENLIWASPLAAEAGVTLTIEALNPIDNPGYFLTSADEGFALVEQVNHSSLRFQFDTYHIQLMEGNLTQRITENADLIGHIQFADVPGRHEPGTGEIHFDNLLASIEASGYQGEIGLEFVPQARGEAALAWCQQAIPQTSQPIRQKGSGT